MPTFANKPACECLAQWLPAYEAELLARGEIQSSLTVYQLIGNVGASAGTHSQGGAFDLGQTSDTAVWVARKMGADATWRRTPAQGFMLHIHGVLRGCPHNAPARYQVAAVDAGFNGLGSGGRGGKDDGPRPLSKRTWQQGLAWQRARAAERAERKRLTLLILTLRAKRAAIKVRIGNMVEKRRAL